MKINRALPLIILFIAHQVSSAAQETNLDSLLQVAVQANDPNRVSELIAAGANPDMKFSSSLQATPLMYASGFQDGKILDLLISSGASLDEVDTNGDPAINWATYYGYVQNMRKLIDAGANLQIKSKHGDALDVAFRLWHTDSVINVFRGSVLDQETAASTRQLMDLIREKKYAKVESIIGKGTDPNVADGLGMSAPHHGVRSGDLKMVNLLLDLGANPNALNKVGQSPLTIAARSGNSDIVKALLNNGADVNRAGEKYRLTALIGAAVGGHTEIIKQLVDDGALINQKDIINQSTALHWSIFYQNNETAKLLIELGASYSTKCLEDQYTAYTLTIASNNKELKNYIESHRSKDNELIDSWKMDEIHYIYEDTTYKVDVHQGSLLIDEKRYSIMYNPSWAPRVPFKNLSKPTDSEILAGFKSIVFNTGPYELTDDNVMLALPDIAKVPGFEGGKQYYKYRIDGDKLYFRMYDETYPNGEKPEWFGKVEVQFILSSE
ncbi:ankyrin repeat domain-containing protein [Ekhidna sp.]|uniref:ankyrin repeat domain-containing protein n=1 Tax=Ekhidna sp. TaxID=2608089 RepID=UPI003CCB9E68